MRATARRTDPASSHQAASRAESSAVCHRQICLDEVRRWPGQTSAEIAVSVGLDRYQTARRLPELAKAGFVERGPQGICSVAGTMAVTWYPAEDDGQGRLF